ncbi:MAG: hypothetical protein SO542_00030, partial [Muribaculaceae bacterium]|nr:hypothetical protein [Muribaculaceae bacterium]
SLRSPPKDKSAPREDRGDARKTATPEDKLLRAGGGDTRKTAAPEDKVLRAGIGAKSSLTKYNMTHGGDMDKNSYLCRGYFFPRNWGRFLGVDWMFLGSNWIDLESDWGWIGWFLG